MRPLGQPAPAHAVTNEMHVPPAEDPDYKETWSPLFKFGAVPDIVTEFNIKEKIWFRVYRNLVEVVIVEEANQTQIAMAAWFLAHAEGHLLVNTPVPDDPKKLLHITNIELNSKISSIALAMTGAIMAYPCHFVHETKFHTANSIFGSAIINKYALRRLYDQLSLKLAETMQVQAG